MARPVCCLPLWTVGELAAKPLTPFNSGRKETKNAHAE